MTPKELEKIGVYRRFHFSEHDIDKDILGKLMVDKDGMVPTRWEDVEVLNWPQGYMHKYEGTALAEHNRMLMLEHYRRRQAAKREAQKGAREAKKK
jgi:hypothetical protein